VRDPRSLKVLASLSIKKAIQVPDAAFSMPTIQDKDASHLFQGDQKGGDVHLKGRGVVHRGRDIDHKGSTIPKLPKGNLVSVSVRYWDHYSKGMTHAVYLKTMAKTLDTLVEMGYTPVFASTCTGFRGYHKDDRRTALQVRKLMRHGGSTKVLTSHLSPEQLVSIYSRMEFHIGTRMHSNIFALTAGVPVLAIAYEDKTYGLMSILKLERYAIDIEELDARRLLEMVKDIAHERDRLASDIKTRTEQLRKASMQTPRLMSR